MDKVEELRAKLKEQRLLENAERERDNGDNNTTTNSGEPVSTASFDTQLYPGNIVTETRHSVQSVPGPSGGTVSNQRQSNGTDRRDENRSRGAAPRNHGLRLTTGRHGENNGQDRTDGIDIQASNRSSEREQREPAGIVSQIGNLVTFDEIPQRHFTIPDTKAAPAIEKPETQGTSPARKRGRPPKQRDGGIIEATKEAEGSELVEQYTPLKVSKSKTLTEKEVKDLTEPLKIMLKDWAKYVDQYLWNIQDLEDGEPVWSDLDKEEIELLVKHSLRAGTKSPVAATAIRGAINAHDYVALGAILRYRGLKTVRIVQNVRQKRKENRKQKLEIIRRK